MTFFCGINITEAKNTAVFGGREFFMDILDKIIKKVEKTTKVVVQKSTDVVELTKVKLAITSSENEADELLREIGSLVYDAYKSGTGNAELVEEKCVKLEKIKGEIEEKKNQFASLRNMKRCPECEYENEADAVYCSKCAAKLPDVVACEVDDMPGESKSEDVVVDAEAEASDE